MITALAVAITLALLVGGTIGVIAGRSNRKRAQVYGVLSEGHSRRHRGTYLYAAATLFRWGRFRIGAAKRL